MHPELFRIGPTPVYSYGLMLVISFALGILLAQRRAKKRGIPPEAVLDVATVILISAVVGSRLLYIAFHVSEFEGRWLDTIDVTKGLAGLSMFGGVALATVMSLWYMRWKRLPVWEMSDVLAPSVALGIGITKIGCLLNGCCFGRPTGLPWGISFPPGCVASSVFGTTTLHPTQLYESAVGFIIFGISLLVDRKRIPSGIILCTVMGLYGVARFLIDFARFQEPSNYAGFMGIQLTVSQVFSLAFVIASAAGAVFFAGRGEVDDRR